MELASEEVKGGGGSKEEHEGERGWRVLEVVSLLVRLRDEGARGDLVGELRIGRSLDFNQQFISRFSPNLFPFIWEDILDTISQMMIYYSFKLSRTVFTWNSGIPVLGNTRLGSRMELPWTD